MKIEYNEIFKQFLTEYNLPKDLSFSVEFPNEVQSILEDEILAADLGITLKSFNKLYKAKHNWENQSIIEDNENHFHVAGYCELPDNKQAFMLGVKTLTALSAKFQREKLSSIRFWYFFQTPELGAQFEKANNLYEEGDEQFISDRLSFYTRRQGEEVISIAQNDSSFWAMLIIDI